MPSNQRSKTPQVTPPERPEAAGTSAADEQTLAGNAFASEQLDGYTPPEDHTDLDLDCDDEPDPLLEEFLGQRFAAANNVPSTGMGCFDAAYNPRAGILQITLRLGFTFTAAENAGLLEYYMTDGGWTDSDKQAWIDGFAKVVENSWATSQSIRCTRPGWCLNVLPVLKIVPVEDGNSHYNVTVSQDPRPGEAKTRPGVAEGTSWVPGGTAHMEEGDTKLGFEDSGVEDTEMKHIKDLNKELIRFEVHGDHATLTPEGATRVKTISADLAARPPGTPSLSVTVEGWGGDGDGNDWRPSLDASRQVVDRLPQKPHRIGPSGMGPHPSGMVGFDVNELRDTIHYDDRFSNASHEVGHMLGLSDEYEDAPKRPDAEARHDLLIESAGVEKVVRDTDTSSIMSAGGDVLPAHMVTMWEVLGRMTMAHLSPKEWQL